MPETEAHFFPASLSPQTAGTDDRPCVSFFAGDWDRTESLRMGTCGGTGQARAWTYRTGLLPPRARRVRSTGRGAGKRFSPESPRVRRGSRVTGRQACESHCAINEGEERRCRNAGVGKSFMRALRKTMRANVTAEKRNAPDLYAGPGRCFCFVTFYGRCSSSSNGRSASRKGRVRASSGVTQRKSCPSLAAGSPENSVMWKKWSRTARKP